jgi:hypothetical protein
MCSLRYDLIFDTVGPRHYTFELMSPLLNRGGTFVTIITPVFPNVDKHGLVAGLSRSAYKAARQTLHVGDRTDVSMLDVNMIYSHSGNVERYELSVGILPS